MKSCVTIPFYYLRKGYFTLLETMIAMTLLSVILTMIFGFFSELSHLTQMSGQVEKEGFKMRYIDSRLAYLFEHVVNENDNARKFYFFTETNEDISPFPSLVLTYDNGVKRDPNFSGDVLGRLYVTDGQLCLVTWPIRAIDGNPYIHMKKEVLIDNVVDFNWGFYYPPPRIKDSKEIQIDVIDTEKTNPERDMWHEEWHKSYDQMPAIVRLTITFKQDQVASTKKKGTFSEEPKIHQFAFVLPTSKNYVYYPPN